MPAATVNLSILVEVEWDEESSVWVAGSSDIPGLVAEHADFKKLQAMVLELVPLLLIENDMLGDAIGDQVVPVHIAASALAKGRALVSV